MRRSMFFFGFATAAATGLWLTEIRFIDSLSAQASRPRTTARPANANPRQLDVRAGDLIDSFVKESAQLALDYEEAGELEKAKQILEAVQTLRPETPGVDQKLKQLDEQMLSSNELKVEVDPAKGWGSPVARVFKGKPIRVQAQGTYRFVTNLSIGPEGFPTSDPAKGEMAAGVPCGALMGIVVSKKPGEPFAIGSGTEHEPKEDGVLFLGVNVPTGSKCSGRIEAQLSGSLARNK